MVPRSPESGAPSGLAYRYLSERGIATATIQAYEIQIDTEPTSTRFKDRLDFDALPKGRLDSLVKEVIWFPCYDSAGNTISWIAKPLPSIGDAKFLNPQGAAFPFIPRQTWVVASKPHKPLVVTEGPLKALAVAQAGQLAIGVSGVWMATQKGADGRIELVPTLREFEWCGRLIYLAFDADATTNPKVKQALFRTFLVLYRHGAKVRFLTWPLSEGKGIDDYLHNKQGAEDSADALGTLLNEGQEVGSLLVPEDLAMAQNELKIANLSGTQINQLSHILSDPFNVRASAIEKDVMSASSDADTKTFDLADPEPWPDASEGTEMLNEIARLFRKHVVMSQSQAVAATLWVALTYVEMHVDVLPILAVTSPTKRCGKTRLLECLSRLTRKALPVSNVSAAALYRSIKKWSPTLIIDEADTFLDGNDELRGIINCGHTRSMAFVIRCDGETLEPQPFSTWCPKVLARIGRLADTLHDRAIEIRMQRKTTAEAAQPIWETSPETFVRLQQQLARWALDHGDTVRYQRPTIPIILNDRAADNWRPLLAVAAVIGGDWPEIATKAALDVHGAQDPEETVPNALLKELQQMFSGADFFPTDEILEALNKNKEAPWADWKHQMTAEKLAKILRSFGVKPKQKRSGGDPVRGYLKEDLKPVFDRYLFSSSPPPPEKPFQPVTPPEEPLPDLIRGVTGSKTQPVTSQVENSDPLRAQSALGLDLREGVTGLQAKTGRRDRRDSLNGFELTLDEAAKIKFAARIFGGEIAGPDEPGLDAPETVLSPENVYGMKLPPLLRPEVPKLSPSQPKGPTPAYSALEERLLSILAPRDYEGGLSYNEFLRQAGLLDEAFDQTLKSLCRRCGPVYKSALNGRYQLNPRFSEILRKTDRTAPLGSG